jgi:hypothetical protein
MTELQLSFTLHALDVLRERCIPEEWVERVVRSPTILLQDADDPVLLHALGRIAERGGRVLRVVYNPGGESVRVVTAFFDRTMRGKL